MFNRSALLLQFSAVSLVVLTWAHAGLALGPLGGDHNRPASSPARRVAELARARRVLGRGCLALNALLYGFTAATTTFATRHDQSETIRRETKTTR